MKLRWDNYILNTDEKFVPFWESYFGDKIRNTLFVIGVGFDPRSIEATDTISSVDKKGKKSIIGLRYFANEEDSESNLTGNEVKINVDRLEKLKEEKKVDDIVVKHIILRSSDDKHIASINATKVFTRVEEISSYTDIILDISAMPRGIFIPLLNKLLSLVDKHNSKSNNNVINLHVVITENPSMDSKIQNLGTAEEATFIHGFTVPDQTLTKDQKKVWIPLLGESQTEQFSLIRKSIEPVETCIVLPFPSKDLKRGDQILDEYKDLLFNDNDFEPRNIVYVNESNPFHVYRMLIQTINRYQKSFALLEGCKVIISALSSKMLSLGAFMAVFESKRGEQNIGIKQVESMSHSIDDKVVQDASTILLQNVPIHVWLAGEPYME
jgi:hypothetical protein